MTQKELNEIARNIIKSNCHLTLATALDNEPWIAPLYYDIDGGKAAYRFFKLIPQKFYILDSEVKVDKRIEVFIL